VHIGMGTPPLFYPMTPPIICCFFSSTRRRSGRYLLRRGVGKSPYRGEPTSPRTTQTIQGEHSAKRHGKLMDISRTPTSTSYPRSPSVHDQPRETPRHHFFIINPIISCWKGNRETIRWEPRPLQGSLSKLYQHFRSDTNIRPNPWVQLVHTLVCCTRYVLFHSIARMPVTLENLSPIKEKHVREGRSGILMMKILRPSDCLAPPETGTVRRENTRTPGQDPDIVWPLSGAPDFLAHKQPERTRMSPRGRGE
jgi:hypothetical protein